LLKNKRDYVKKLFIPAVFLLLVVLAIHAGFSTKPDATRVPQNAVTTVPVSETLAPSTMAVAPPAEDSSPPASPVPLPSAALEQAPDDELETLREDLASSSDAGDLLVAASLEGDEEKREALLFEALMLDPYNALVNFMVIEHCLITPNSSQCGPHVFDVLESLDANNGAVSDLQAIQAYRNGDVDSALEALSQATSAKVTDDYRWQHIAAIGDSLEKRGMEKDGEFFIKTQRLSAQRSGERMMAMIRMCNEQNTNAQWRDACMGRGVSMSSNALSQSSQMLGYGLAAHSGQSEEPFSQHYRSEMEGKSRYYYSLLQNVASTVDNSEGWHLTDQQWQDYLNVYANKGETAALEYVLHISP